MNTRRYFLALTAASLLLATNCLAESQGLVGETSTGEADISIEIPKLVKITGMADLDFGKYNGDGAESDDQPVCIYSNMEADDNSYMVTATGTGASNSFAIQRQGEGVAAHDIVYTVDFNDQSSPGGETLDAGVAETGQTGWSNDPSCGTANANYQVTFSQTALLAAPPGNYTGTLTLVIEPE